MVTIKVLTHFLLRSNFVIFPHLSPIVLQNIFSVSLHMERTKNNTQLLLLVDAELEGVDDDFLKECFANVLKDILFQLVNILMFA